MSTPPRETIQKQIQQDWANREYIEVITGSIKKITDFLNSFGKFAYIKYNFQLYLKNKAYHFNKLGDAMEMLNSLAKISSHCSLENDGLA